MELENPGGFQGQTLCTTSLHTKSQSLEDVTVLPHFLQQRKDIKEKNCLSLQLQETAGICRTC